MDKDLYILLIYKELKGELSDSEAASLKSFYEESEANRELRDEIQLSWMLSQEVEDHSEIEINVDADLSKVKTTLGHDEVKEKVVAPKVKVIPMWRRLASVAAIVIPLLCGAYFLFQFLNQSEALPIVYETDTTKKEFLLKDGSSVTLNRFSKIEIAADFNKTSRNVKLSGEAFFDVAKDAKKPFVIEIENRKVTVLGTSFNIKDDDEEMSVAVISGIVKVESENDSVILNKNEKAIYSKKSNDLIQSSLSNTNELLWKTGMVVYKSEPLLDVLTQLEKLYSSEIELENSEISDCGISFVSQNTDLQTILKKVENAVKGKFKQVDDNKYQLMGGTCK